MPQKPFQPINGLEARKIILREVERSLDSDWRFKQHVTFPLVRWTWKLNVQVGGIAKSEFVIATSAENGGEVAETIEHEQERIIEAPVAGQTADAVRRENGLGVPDPRAVVVAPGIMQTVDTPELAVTPEPVPVTVGEEEPVSATPAPPRSPVIAKSTSLKLKPLK